VSPEFLGLSRVDFITIGTVGPPGRRTFYLQGAQGDLLVSLIIEKEHAAALSMGVQQLLERLGGVHEWESIPTEMDLREPLEPLFRVGSLGLGYDPDEDAVVVIARAQVGEEEEEEEEKAPEVHMWCSRAQVFALAEHAAGVVAAGRPQCPLCNEPLEPGRRHTCVRGNGRKWLFHVDE
jgi:uncharacterized repeat protein (TIGR03847 family)